jgi:hypothetical protein
MCKRIVKFKIPIIIKYVANKVVNDTCIIF